MDRPQNKNSLCIFCYKPACLHNSNENRNGFNEWDFLKLFSRYIHLRQERYKQVPISELMFCENCTVIVNSFRECYSKLELIRLEMGSKVQKLFETMSAADKSSSLVSLFQKQFKPSAQLGREDADSDSSNIYYDIKEMRRDLIFYGKFDERKKHDLPR